MFTVVRGLKELVKKVHEDVTVDGLVFRLHTVLTSTILFACSAIVTATQFVGNPISCIVNGLPVHAINTYCWITSTFTVPKMFDKNMAAHPGVMPDEHDENRKYHSYYQWVCFVLFFQGVACYAPKWIWGQWENGLLRTLIAGMNNRHLVAEDKDRQKERLLIYLIDHIKRHRWYAFKYWLCEVICLINVFVQMYAMNVFFSGEFYHYGLRVFNLLDNDQENRIDPMVYIFPRVTKCIFRKFGPSGTIQKHDALCILPLNIINEKTYVIIWFWFAISAVALCLLLCYRTIMLCSSSLRPKLLRISPYRTSKKELKTVGRKIDIGDWWVLYMLGKNLDPLIYSELIVDLAGKFDDRGDLPMKVR